MTKFIKLTEIVCNGHEIMSRTVRFFNSAHIVSLTPMARTSGHTPKCTAMAMDPLNQYGAVYVEEDAGWIAQELGCK